MIDENSCLYEFQGKFNELSAENLNEIYDYFCNELPLFEKLSEQMKLSKEEQRAEFLNELHNIYNNGEKNGSNGLIYCADMERFYDNNEDEMLDYLDEVANSYGCNNKMEVLAKYYDCDLEDYKWKSVQNLAYNYSIRVMETTLLELNLKKDNSQELVDENTQTDTNKPKKQTR